MVGIIITILFILVLLTGLYCLYRYVFCFSAKKRPDAHCIPVSNLYNDHRDKMLECIRDMENTPYEEVNVQSIDGYRLFGKLYNIKKNAPLMIFFHGYPILFIHGKQDAVVPMYMTEELYENCAGTKEKVVIEGADHANSAMTDYAAYEKAVVKFLFK